MEHKPLGQLLVLQTALEYLLQQGGIRLSGDEPKDYDPKGFHVGPREGHYFKPGEREAGGKEVEIVQAPEAEITIPEVQQEEEEEDVFDYADDPDDEDYVDEYDEEAAGMPEAQYNAIGQADGFHGNAQTEGWGSDVEVEDDHFSPEGEQNGPQGYAHEVKEYAKQAQEESGIPIIGGPTGNEPAKEVYEHHGLEVGHMGGNPITLTHIKDYIEAKGGKAPDASWETTMTEKSFNLSKLLVLESALEHLAKATLKGEHPERDSEEFVFQKSMKNVVKVGDVDIPVEIALDPVRGLSGRGSMNPGTGMLFRMVNARDFWMKDMRFPLDIIWINDKREVVDISENLPIPTSASHSLPLYSPKRLAVYALEINGGEAKALGINIGDAVEINVS